MQFCTQHLTEVNIDAFNHGEISSERSLTTALSNTLKIVAKINQDARIIPKCSLILEYGFGVRDLGYVVSKSKQCFISWVSLKIKPN